MSLVDRVRRLCEEPLTDRLLRDRVIDEIARVVLFDAHLLVLTDPSSGVISSPHVALPEMAQTALPALIRHRYSVAEPDWPTWLRAEHGIADTVHVKLVDRYGRWGFLELWRADAVFSAAERDAVSAIAGPLTAGLRQALARTFVGSSTAALGAGSSPSTPLGGVIVLGADLHVRAETDAAAKSLLALLPPTEDAPPVPAIALNVGAALLAIESVGSPSTVAAWTRAHLGDGRWVTAHAERAADTIVVSIAPCSSAERTDLFGRCHGFSPREVAVFDLVLGGRAARDIADTLQIAPTTAEDHLRALLAKSGSESRQQLVLRALGGGPSRPSVD